MEKKVKLSPDEEELEQSFEKNEFKKLPQSVVNSYQSIARESLASKKEERLNIRLSKLDLNLVKEQAEEAGLPYQTFIGSVLHKFVTHQLIERRSVEEAVKIVQTSGVQQFAPSKTNRKYEEPSARGMKKHHTHPSKTLSEKYGIKSAGSSRDPRKKAL